MMRTIAISLWRYHVAVGAVAAALFLTTLIPPLREQGHSPLFFAAVVLASWFGGLGPGLVASLLSAWAIDYFLVAPAYALVLGVDDVVRTAAFLLVAFLITWLDAVRKRLEAALRKRAVELAEAHRHKDTFLAVLAHELRSPLAPLANALHLIRLQGSKVSEIERTCEIAERQVRQMARLVEDLLDLARLAHGKVRLQRKLVDLTGVISRAVEAARPLVDSRGHELIVRLPGNPLIVDADPARLEQILINLLTNAAKYTPRGGQIRLTAVREACDVLLRIADTGLGIPPEILRTFSTCLPRRSVHGMLRRADWESVWLL